MEPRHFEDLATKGYCVVAGYLDEREVRAVREAADAILAEETCGTMPPSLLLESDELKRIFFSDRLDGLVADLSRESGPQILYPDFTIRKGLHGGWRIDDRMISKPVDEPWDFPSILMFNVFLQKNDLIKGGGLDIVPGSHLSARAEREEAVSNHEHSFRDTVSCEAGDLVVFDYRAVHRGTVSRIAVEGSRLALRWTFSTGDEVTQDYLKHLRARLTKKIRISDFANRRAAKSEMRFFEDLSNITADLVEESVGREVFVAGLEYRGLADILERDEDRDCGAQDCGAKARALA